MGVNQELTERIRSIVGLDPRVAEKRMFGGICFLLKGRILVSSGRTGSMMAQCGAEAAKTAVTTPGVSYLVMRGKPSPNFIDIEADLVEDDDDLRKWVELAERYVGALPPKVD